MIAPSGFSFKLLSYTRATRGKAAHCRDPETEDRENTESDSKKRSFLKLAGVIGAGAVAATLLPKRADALVFGSTPTSGVVGLKNQANQKIDPAQETGGNLATINTNTAPFVVSGAGGYVRQDTTGTIAKETGGNLATIATNIPAKGQAAMAASMPVVIASDQPAIPVSGSFSVSAVGVKNIAGSAVNPSTDDSVIWLRRVVKLMESQAVVDVGNRQKITLDSITAGLTLSTVSTVSSVTNVVTLASQGQQMYQDPARNAYANGIRQNLTFS